MAFDDSYNTVAERIVEFFAKYPEGTLSRFNLEGKLEPLEFHTFAGKDWVLLTAFAYRGPDDRQPGVGTVWEQVPGGTNFTRGSEIQNAETSAWGRALVAIGAADTRKGIASDDEVQQAKSRQAELPPRDFVAEAKELGVDRPKLQAKWQEAKRLRAPKAQLDEIAKLGQAAKEAEEAAAALADPSTDAHAAAGNALAEGFAGAAERDPAQPLPGEPV